jgi:hypothetical protein
MHTLGQIGKELNRSHLYVREVLKRFEVPLAKHDHYSEATLAFLRTVVYLRTFNISEERLRDLWLLERKLLQLLHVDSAGSPTWFLDSCGLTSHQRRRLLLSNYDLGFALPARAVQLGLNFAEVRAELFAGKEMGEDAIRVLGETLKLHHAICGDLGAERENVTAANRWARRFG